MNTALQTNTATATTMSTREIAELTGKKNMHIQRDFRDMCEALEIDSEGYIQFWIDPQNGQKYSEYVLPKDLTTTLVSGYSIPMRHKIVMRWIELEAKVSTPASLPTSYREAMMLAVERYEQLEAAKEQLAIAAPKVQVYDTVVCCC